MSFGSLPARFLARRGGATRRYNYAIFCIPRGTSRAARTGATLLPTERTICRNFGVDRRLYATQQHSHNENDDNNNNNNNKIGLFSIPGLIYPNDFQRLTKQAIQESDSLRSSIPGSIESQNQARDALYQLDQISRTVCNVIDAAELCRSAHADPQWRDAANTAFFELQDYIATLNTDQRLYNALAMVEDGYFADLSEEERRFCLLLKREFELDGIHLPDQEREGVKQLHNTVTTLETLFANNITNSRKEFWVDADLVEAVIPKHVLEANGAVYGNSSSDGNTAEQQQQVQLTAASPISHSITSFASSGALRKEVYIETMTSCPENLDVLDAMIDARHQLARTLNFESYSHRFLQDKMAQSPSAVFEFLQDLQGRIQPAYQKEMGMLSHAKHQVEGNSVIEPWDVKFYVKLLKAQGGVDPNALAPYLSLSNCLKAMKLLTKTLFGIHMEEMDLEDAERWDIIRDGNNNNHAVPSNKEEQIRKFVVSEEDTGRELGTMYLDLHPRPGKYTHAAHFTVRCGCLENGPDSDYQKPIVALVCNMNTGQASFSSHQEVETFLHEFGHALHSLLSRTNFQHLSGTRAAMDFVETPSHLMEHYAWCKHFLPLLATNADGEPLPESMVQGLSQSRNQFRFLEMQNQIVLSNFDQTIFGPQLQSNDQRMPTKDVWAAMHRQSGVPFADNTHWFTNVGHLVTYGAGYYGYLYSQVFADAIWNELFHKQSLNRTSGERIWKKMLIHGGARDANVILEDLLGHKPTVDNYWKSLVKSMKENGN